MPARGRRLPLDMRGELASPFGDLIDEKRLSEKRDGAMLLTVGDVVSLSARRAGVVPRLSVYDGRSERREMSEYSRLVDEREEERISVENPAGTVTAELMDAIEKALTEGGPWNIKVEGEEDLAVLACILLAPKGTWVVYGQPGEGMVLVVTDDEALERTKELWNRMEELE